jgi:hypothetical protein
MRKQTGIGIMSPYPDCVTTPHTTGATAPTDGSTCNTVYDLFDRVQTIQQPDGHQGEIPGHDT